jgi:hypothetical protein
VIRLYLTHPERLLVELAKLPPVTRVTVVPDVTGDGARVYAEVAAADLEVDE